jgi:hypothetical protein
MNRQQHRDNDGGGEVDYKKFTCRSDGMVGIYL